MQILQKADSSCDHGVTPALFTPSSLTSNPVAPKTGTPRVISSISRLLARSPRVNGREACPTISTLECKL